MDENITENNVSLSTNKFIFADAFYDGLIESNMENSIGIDVNKDEEIINESNKDNTSFQQVQEIDNSSNFVDSIEDTNKFKNVSDSDQLSNITKEESVNIGNNLANMDFLLSGSSDKKVVNEANKEELFKDNSIETISNNNITFFKKNSIFRKSNKFLGKIYMDVRSTIHIGKFL